MTIAEIPNQVSNAPVHPQRVHTGQEAVLVDAVADALTAPVHYLEGDALHESVRDEMHEITQRFIGAVVAAEEVDVAPKDRIMRIGFSHLDPANYALRSGWQPGSVYGYSSSDPFRENNPDLAQAADELIEATISVTTRLGATNDPELTYLTSQRSKGGKKSTVVTQALQDSDEGIGDWITHLPDAERLRPVAHPWKDGSTFVYNEDSKEFEEIPNSKALNALVGGSKDGRAVIEREAWERTVLTEVINVDSLPNGTLTVTSLGTGTGEPAMDTALALVQRSKGDSDKKVLINGFDINPKSLQVAAHMAELKKRASGGVQLDFEGHVANLLSTDGIEQAVAGTQAQVYEAVGFAEYVPSDYASSPIEQQQREFMKALGCLSAEEFYAGIYENMPEGSVLITGNMRNDSPQAPFVIDGLGWKGIIQRSTEEYLQIIDHAGIPSEAVRLFVPVQDESGGVYNLVAITKLPVQ